MAPRWPAAEAVVRASGVVVVVVMCMLAAATSTASAQKPAGGGLEVIHIPVRDGKKNSKSTCMDSKNKRPGCDAICPSRCPNKCLVLCPTCKTFCLCDFYPGVSCGDPRFTGGDGNNFFFHGKKDHDFCIVSDADLHVNAHFIGNRNSATGRDFTWIQAVGVLFGGHHRLSLSAVRSARWDATADHLDIAFDGERVALPLADGARWSSATVPALSVTRTAAADSVVVELKGSFRIVATAVPITAEESRVHSYGVTAADCLAHLDLGFKFQALTDDVHGVLGQTYRPDYVSSLNVAAKMPIMGGAASFLSSGLFTTDCAVSRFGRASAGEIAMVTDGKHV